MKAIVERRYLQTHTHTKHKMETFFFFFFSFMILNFFFLRAISPPPRRKQRAKYMGQSAVVLRKEPILVAHTLFQIFSTKSFHATLFPTGSGNDTLFLSMWCVFRQFRFLLSSFKSKQKTQKLFLLYRDGFCMNSEQWVDLVAMMVCRVHNVKR